MDLRAHGEFRLDQTGSDSCEMCGKLIQETGKRGEVTDAYTRSLTRTNVSTPALWHEWGMYLSGGV